MAPNRFPAFIQSIGLLNVIAEPRQPGLGKVNGKHGKFGVVVLGADRLVETIGKQNGSFGARQGLQGNGGGQRLPVSIVVAPADLYIMSGRIIAVRRPMPSRDI